MPRFLFGRNPCFVIHHSLRTRLVFRLGVVLLALGVFGLFPLGSQDFKTQFQPEEGYMQAWNFTFRNDQYQIFATFLVSNFGPGSQNNGVSMLLKKKGQPVFYSTREFDADSYESKKGQFFQRSDENIMEIKNGKYSIFMKFPDWEIQLELHPKKGQVPISKGRYPLGDSKFIQADIPLSFAKATGTIRFKDEVETVVGRGGMEHILTNHEVYKYSKKWELVRTETNDGHRIFTGGFIGNENFPGGYFRRVAILGPLGNLILEANVEKAEVLEWEKEPVSGYTIPKKEVLHFLDNSCTLEVKRTKNIASISALENISTFLRFFIQLFFAKPYQIHSSVELKLDCSIYSGSAKGIHSNYLINE
ncbi:hypothetical protein P3G55_11010 [Leptospira sp. 96542]|nr:hypothetical protein [Leptospira sp. 96542]